MVAVRNKTTGEMIGEITPKQLQFLIDQLEEESIEDRDYSITPMEIAYWSTRGADEDLLALLRKALGDKDEVIIEWVK